jgi:phospholipid/cholesterol/gamma-HCH transport system substrate-binding protein
VLRLGAAGIAVIAVLVVAAVKSGDIAAAIGQRPCVAEFAEAAGLESGDDVRVAGVTVGEVTGLDLRDGHVEVAFRLDRDLVLGDRTGASIRIQTVLGRKYLAVAPAGSGRVTRIPLGRTASPYDLAQAVTGLGDSLGKLDSGRLAQAFDALSAAFADTPAAVQGSVRGLSKLSAAIAARDAELRQLLARSRSVTGALAGRDAEFAKLIDDGALLLREVTARRDAVAALLTSTSALATQLTALIGENRAQLGPALNGLRDVVTMLRRNQGALDKSLTLLGPYVRAFGSAAGNGKWIDVYAGGLPR